MPSDTSKSCARAGFAELRHERGRLELEARQHLPAVARAGAPPGVLALERRRPTRPNGPGPSGCQSRVAGADNQRRRRTREVPGSRFPVQRFGVPGSGSRPTPKPCPTSRGSYSTPVLFHASWTDTHLVRTQCTGRGQSKMLEILSQQIGTSWEIRRSRMSPAAHYRTRITGPGSRAHGQSHGRNVYAFPEIVAACGGRALGRCGRCDGSNHQRHDFRPRRRPAGARPAGGHGQRDVAEPAGRPRRPSRRRTATTSCRACRRGHTRSSFELSGFETGHEDGHAGAHADRSRSMRSWVRRHLERNRQRRRQARPTC